MNPSRPLSGNFSFTTYPEVKINAPTKIKFDVKFKKFTDSPPAWVEPVALKLKLIYERISKNFNSTGLFKYNFPYKTFNICFKIENGFTLILNKVPPLEIELKNFFNSGYSLLQSPADDCSNVLDFSHDKDQKLEPIDPSITAFQLY